MRNGVLFLGKAGVFVGMLLTVLSYLMISKSKELNDGTLVLFGLGFLTFIVSLLIVMVAKIFVSNRDETRSVIGLKD